MHSNGGRRLVSKARPPDVAEGRRGGPTAALSRPRSYGGTFSTAGASGELVSIMSDTAFLFAILNRAELEFVADDQAVDPASLQWSRQRREVVQWSRCRRK